MPMEEPAAGAVGQAVVHPFLAAPDCQGRTPDGPPQPGQVVVGVATGDDEPARSHPRVALAVKDDDDPWSNAISGRPRLRWLARLPWQHRLCWQTGQSRLTRVRRLTWLHWLARLARLGWLARPPGRPRQPRWWRQAWLRPPRCGR